MKENKIEYIFKKLPVRDRLIVALFSVAALFLLIMVVFGFIFGKFDKKKVFFPAATMSDTNLYQHYTMKSYENLPVTIAFPSIPYGMHVGGTEQPALEDGCSFSYNEKCTIVACEALHDMETPDIIISRMYSFLYGRDADTACTYDQAICSSGYMNGLYADYESGTYTVAGVERYLVGYRYYTGLDKDILFFVVTEDGTILSACKHLLDQMYYSMFSFDPMDGIEAVVGDQDVGKNDVSDGAEHKEPESAAGETIAERKRLMEALQERIDQESFSDSAYIYDDSDLLIPVMVNDSYVEAVFFLSYTNVSKIPQRMLLYSPDGTVFDHASCGELTGEIAFEVTAPAQGEWIMVVSNEGGLGTYHAQVVEKESYEALHRDNAYVEDREGPPAD